MARKKTVGSLIVTMFLKSFGVVIVMMLIGVISYKFTMQYYEVSKADSQGESILDIVGDVTADAVSRNLIYSVDEETSKIKTMVIEVLNTETGNLDFITIPAHLQFAINNDVYQRLYEAGIDVPQIIKMSNLNEYFNNDTSYEYGMLLLEDYFDIDLGYYTMMNEDLFNEIFEQSEEYDYYVITEDLKKDVALLEDQSELDAFMKERMNLFKSNLKIKSKLKYSSDYMKINPELIYYHILPGVAEGGAFKVTQEEGHQLYQMVLVDQTHITLPLPAHYISQWLSI